MTTIDRPYDGKRVIAGEQTPRAFLMPFLNSLATGTKTLRGSGSEGKEHGGLDGEDGGDDISPEKILQCMAVLGTISGAAVALYFRHQQRSRPSSVRKSRLAGLSRLTPMSRQVASFMKMNSTSSAFSANHRTSGLFHHSKSGRMAMTRVQTMPNMRTGVQRAALGEGHPKRLASASQHDATPSSPACGEDLSIKSAPSAVNRPTLPRGWRSTPRMLSFSTLGGGDDTSPTSMADEVEDVTDKMSPAPSSISAPQTPLLPRLGEEDFTEMFYTIDHANTGYIDFAGVQDAVQLMNQEFRLGLLPDDAGRLFAFLGGDLGDVDHSRINQKAFVEGFNELFKVFLRLSRQLTLGQLRVVVAAAFERFDLNGDGHISEEEFLTACGVLGLEMSVEEAKTLHRFFAPSESLQLKQATVADSRPFWEKWGSAIQSSFDQMRKRYQLDSVGHLGGKVLAAMQAPGTPGEKLERAAAAACDATEHIAAAAELAVTGAGVAVASQYIGESIHGAQDLMSVDLGEIAPFLMFLGLSTVNLAKELDELTLKEMSEDEALLYAQVFHSGGFSQAEFRRLLSCKSCRWGTVEAGEKIFSESESSLKIIVKGEAHFNEDGNTIPMRGGSIIGATQYLRGHNLWDPNAVRTTEKTTFITWDCNDLHHCLAHNKEMALRMDRLLATDMAAKIRAEERLKGQTNGKTNGRRPSAAGAFNPFGLRMATVAEDTLQPPQLTAKFQGQEPEIDGERDSVLRAADLQLMVSHLNASLTASAVGAAAGAATAAAAVPEVPAAAAAPSNGMVAAAAERLFSTADTDGKGAIGCGEVASKLRAVQEDFVAQAPALADDIAVDDNGPLGWLAALPTALAQQADRKGFSRFCYMANRVHEVLQSEGDPLEKAKQVVAFVWDGTDEIADFVEAMTDATGTCAALYGVWQEVSEGIVPGDIDGMNLAPFLIFLGICGTQAAKQHAEGRMSDLSNDEAAIYKEVFEAEGFTVAEFRRLLRHAERREEYSKGDTLVSSSDDGQLRLVLRGSFQVTNSNSGTVSRGGFFPEAALLGGASRSSEEAELFHATEATETLVWDRATLQAQLEHDEHLQTKVLRMATLAMADKLLASRQQIVPPVVVPPPVSVDLPPSRARPRMARVNSIPQELDDLEDQSPINATETCRSSAFSQESPMTATSSRRSSSFAGSPGGQQPGTRRACSQEAADGLGSSSPLDNWSPPLLFGVGAVPSPAWA